MSLILTRKAWQAVQVGDRVVTVERVARANVNLSVGKCVHNCAPGDTIILEPGVTITVVTIAKGHVRLAFDAPKHVKIVRTELVEHALNS